jgi:hypothetical protein
MLFAVPPKVASAAHPAAIGRVRTEPSPEDEPPSSELPRPFYQISGEMNFNQNMAAGIYLDAIEDFSY